MATRAATGNLVGGSSGLFSLPDLINLHRGFKQRGEGRRLGRLVKIVLAELPKDVTLALADVERITEGRTLDWFDRGPTLSLSPGDVDILVTSQLEPLPKKPQPGWKAPEMVSQAIIEKSFAETGKWKPPSAPLVEQRPEDRGCTRVKGTTMLCFEPVHEILYRPLIVQTWGVIHAVTDQSSGTKMAFLWDVKTGEGFFYGGRFTVRE